MRIRVDKTGRRYGRLLVLGLGPRKGKFLAWLCQCDCGKQIVVRTGALRPGNRPGSTNGCGCMKQFNGKHLRTHGARYTTEYNSWRSIHDRCYSPNNPQYYLYGGRGIGMCDQWKDFTKFLEDMGHKPTPKHTIDRIDPNGQYEPSNCRWATPMQQARNKRNTLYVTLGDERLTFGEIGERYGVDSKLLYARVKTNGQQLESALKAMGAINV